MSFIGGLVKGVARQMQKKSATNLAAGTIKVPTIKPAGVFFVREMWVAIYLGTPP
jgi:hypothetical protein